MTSSPLRVVATGVGLGVCSGLAAAVGEGDSLGVGDGDGVVCGAARVKFAQGFGATLAHSLWTPGGSPGNGLTLVMKFPLLSALAPPAILLGWSQYSVICSLGRNAPPFTVIWVVGSPAVTSSEMKALFGIGVGNGLGDGMGVGLGDGVVATVGDGLGEAAVRRIHNPTGTRTRTHRMKAGNDTKGGLVTREAMESTRPKSVRGTATVGR